MKKLRIFLVTLVISSMLCGCSGGSSYESNYNSGFDMNSAMSTDSSWGGSKNTVNGFNSSVSGSNNYYEGSYNDSYYPESDDMPESEINTDHNAGMNLVEDKLVYRCSMEIETLNYDDTYASLQQLIIQYGGRIESEWYSNNRGNTVWRNNVRYENSKYGRIIIRVPSKNYNEFINAGANLGNLLDKQTSIENITQEYFDNTAIVEGLEKQEARLLEMMDRAYEVSDMIQINAEITSVQNQINKLKTRLRTMDMDVAYSYITVTIQEVVELTEAGEPQKTNKFIDRLKNVCIDSWERFLALLEGTLFAIIGLVPDLIMLAIILGVVSIIFHKRIAEWVAIRKKRKEDKKNGARLTIKQLDETLKNQENSGK